MVEIIRFGHEHIREAAQIEALCFSDPWSEAGLELLTREEAVAFACMADGRLAAYAGMISVLDEGQIINVATHPDFQRRGFARAVLGALVDYADQNGIVTLSLEVRESNAPAISLYRSAGFVVAGQRPRYYRFPTETATVMVRTKKQITAQNQQKTGNN
ncbi:MAG: ribosomal protein S18-alanine N-acetyltransferase [Eubacteriales bacterium]|jgi:ribosomal-protein-alanine N-acetyltransferase